MVQWHEVTWYSKLGAIIIFVGVVPALSFYIGTQYQLTKEVFVTVPQESTLEYAPKVGKQQEKNFGYAPSAEDEQQMVFREQFRTASYIFYCAARPATESSCWMYASKLDGSARQWLQIQLDYGSDRTGLLLSPDKNNVLVIRETNALTVDTNTLAQKEIVKAEEGTEFGTYTGFPSFIPEGRWVDNTTVELGVYTAGSQEENSIPLERRQIKIN